MVWTKWVTADIKCVQITLCANLLTTQNTFRPTIFPPSPISKAHYFLHWAPDSFPPCICRKGLFLHRSALKNIGASSWEDATWNYIFIARLGVIWGSSWGSFMNVKTFSMLSMEKKERKNMTNSKRLNFIVYLCQQFRLDSQNWGRVRQEVLPL